MARQPLAAVPRSWATRAIDEDVWRVVETALARLTAAGLRTRDVHLATEPSFTSTYVTIVMREALEYHAPRMSAHASAYTPRVRERLHGVEPPSAEDYADALAQRARITADVDAVLGAADVMLLPTVAIEPPPIGADTLTVASAEMGVRAAMLRVTQPFNLSRHPALTLPCGTTEAGFPVGLQIVGRSTGDVVRWGRTFARVLSGHPREGTTM
jgi:aspartyl-tRNA(Asn)/glutamyl-tRNA(Gln) amidotransferase subunit A